MPANALAWAAGMPAIFWGIHAAQPLGPTPGAALLAGVLLLAGALVGGVHGAVLVRLVAGGSRTAT